MSRHRPGRRHDGVSREGGLLQAPAIACALSDLLADGRYLVATERRARQVLREARAAGHLVTLRTGKGGWILERSRLDVGR